MEMVPGLNDVSCFFTKRTLVFIAILACNFVKACEHAIKLYRQQKLPVDCDTEV